MRQFPLFCFVAAALCAATDVIPGSQNNRLCQETTCTTASQDCDYSSGASCTYCSTTSPSYNRFCSFWPGITCLSTAASPCGKTALITADMHAAIPATLNILSIFGGPLPDRSYGLCDLASAGSLHSAASQGDLLTVTSTGQAPRFAEDQLDLVLDLSRDALPVQWVLTNPQSSRPCRHEAVVLATQQVGAKWLPTQVLIAWICAGDDAVGVQQIEVTDWTSGDAGELHVPLPTASAVIIDQLENKLTKLDEAGSVVSTQSLDGVDSGVLATTHGAPRPRTGFGLGWGTVMAAGLACAGALALWLRSGPRR